MSEGSGRTGDERESTWASSDAATSLLLVGLTLVAGFLVYREGLLSSVATAMGAGIAVVGVCFGAAVAVLSVQGSAESRLAEVAVTVVPIVVSTAAVLFVPGEVLLLGAAAFALGGTLAWFVLVGFGPVRGGIDSTDNKR